MMQPCWAIRCLKKSFNSALFFLPAGRQPKRIDHRAAINEMAMIAVLVTARLVSQASETVTKLSQVVDKYLK